MTLLFLFYLLCLSYLVCVASCAGDAFVHKPLSGVWMRVNRAIALARNTIIMHHITLPLRLKWVKTNASTYSLNS